MGQRSLRLEGRRTKEKTAKYMTCLLVPARLFPACYPGLIQMEETAASVIATQGVLNINDTPHILSRKVVSSKHRRKKGKV